jgi:ribosomal-protein-alanine N-acetyltransferase
MSAAASFPELLTRRLRLREPVAADAPALFEIHRDAHAMKWFGSDPPEDLAAAGRIIEGFASMRTLSAPGIRWAIALRESDGTLVGTCGLFRWNRGWRVCLTGYELAPWLQGRGLMREALRGIYAWGFEVLSLQRIEAQVHPDNARSIALLKGLGFVEEGLMREAGLWMGERRDLVLLGLLQREFDATDAYKSAGRSS